ncbi:hypothetical protein NLJ89_g4290 [Agrocybe chaxingu]|uniref:Uncharacterized protein n=1 Tax=Agrocybe chaxingu TaxID=84603 RepID=A0A9W8K2Y9_9AGAR|nr:hypothetical protein NLJ89_g4290 [Agrocybe chaxingu]
MRDLLSTFHYFPYFPDLESLAVEYYTAGPRPSDDSKTNLKNHPPKQLVSFRVPIVQLTLEYHFSQREPAWFVDALCFSGQQNRWARQNCVPWALPHLEHVTMPLSIQDQDLGDVLERCPHLEVVQEEVEVTVKIMSTSMGVEDERMAGTIIHGALCRPVGREGKENGAIVASGRALGFVLPLSATYAQLKIVGDGGDEARKVHILVRRCCFAM